MIDIRIEGKTITRIQESEGWAICTFVIPPGKGSISAFEMRYVSERGALAEIARLSGRVGFGLDKGIKEQG